MTLKLLLVYLGKGPFMLDCSAQQLMWCVVLGLIYTIVVM